MKEYNEEFRKYFNEIKEFCERNKKMALDKLTVLSDAVEHDYYTEEALKDEDETVEESGEKKEEVVENNLPLSGSEDKRKMTLPRPSIPKQSSFEFDTPRKKRTVFKIVRSSSLTCAELVEDIKIGRAHV